MTVVANAKGGKESVLSRLHLMVKLMIGGELCTMWRRLKVLLLWRDTLSPLLKCYPATLKDFEASSQHLTPINTA
jgi:hypothetical protein